MKGVKMFKNGDSFFYILKRYYNENGINKKEYYVSRYTYCQKWDYCFDRTLMFTNQQDAENKAQFLNKMAK